MKLPAYATLFIIVLGIFLAGCSTEIITNYQCLDGSFKDTAELCSEVSCDVETNTETIEKEVIKYQCNDGTIKDYLTDCPAIEEPEVEETTNYDSSKYLINRKQTKDSFEFTVKYAGFDGIDYKVEFEVKNIGSKSEYFQPDAIAILDSKNNQYDVAHSSKYTVSTMSSTILPMVIKKGFWLFEGIPRNSGMGKFRFEIGFMDVEVFSFDVPLN